MAKPGSPRIPLELQRIFLASNAGEVVDEPPKGGLGFRVFKKAIRLVNGSGGHRRSSTSSKRRKKRTGKERQCSVATICQDKSSSSTADTVWSSPSKSLKKNVEDLASFETPQLLLEGLLLERGYSTAKYNANDTSFRFKPTPYELASYHDFTLKIVDEEKDDATLRNVLEAGISPNACNRDCELLLHRACRLGKHQHVRVFLEFGADLRVCSAFGRTALHDACYGTRPSFQAFGLIVEKDPSLVFMKDIRGLCPLEYIRKEHYLFWFEYLECNIDKYWPMLSEEQPKISSRCLGKPFTRTLAKPRNALPPELAHMIAAGKMSTNDVLLLVEDDVSVQCRSAVRTDRANNNADFTDSTESWEHDNGDSSSNSTDDDDDCSEDAALLSELGLLLR